MEQELDDWFLDSSKGNEGYDSCPVIDLQTRESVAVKRTGQSISGFEEGRKRFFQRKPASPRTGGLECPANRRVIVNGL